MGKLYESAVARSRSRTFGRDLAVEIALVRENQARAVRAILIRIPSHASGAVQATDRKLRIRLRIFLELQVLFGNQQRIKIQFLRRRSTRSRKINRHVLASRRSKQLQGPADSGEV